MGRLLLRVLAGAFALVLALSLLSFHPLDPHPFSDGTVGQPIHNLCGTFGALLAGTLQILTGVGAWLIPAYILWECFPSGQSQWPRRVAWAALALSVWTLLGGLGPRVWHLEAGQLIELRWGGWVGRLLWPPCRRLLGPVGLPLVLALLISLAVLLLMPAVARFLHSYFFWNQICSEDSLAYRKVYYNNNFPWKNDRNYFVFCYSYHIISYE